MKLLIILLTVFNSFLSNMETKTLQSDFTVTIAEDLTAPMNYPGTITMQGRKFLLTMFGIRAAYDGQTLYMFSADTDELTLSNPTEQELVQTNPFLYARALVGECNITERQTSDMKQTIITLTPKDQSIGINRFLLRVRNSDLIPLQVEVKEGMKLSTLKLTNPAFVTTEQKYTIEPEETTFINDMRL